ncbi:MAG: biotin/lipoate A/B protein ligase family protein [Coriobacteriia bacterium]
MSTRPAWRLIIEEAPCDGVWNMALDRAIQLERADGRVPPTLRLYSWTRPTVSLGKFQKLSGVDFDACRDEGVDVVRRFTGGRGVLHDDEVTYSVVASLEDGVPRGTSASYRLLCGGLILAYRNLGVEASLTARSRGEAASSACYMHATQADLSLGAAKLSGSAQVWAADTVLQHGSFVITRDVHREARVFRLDEDGMRRLAEQTATLADAVGADMAGSDAADADAAGTLSREAIIEAAAEGMAEALGITMEPGSITDAERERARLLMEEVVVTPGAGR